MPTVPFERKAHYHETDQMGIIYHANYIHWFEEARVDFMNRIGMGYKALEQAGIVSPVLMVHVEYKSMVRFDDTVIVYCDLAYFDGVRMEVKYRVADKETGETRCTGYTKHCFVGNTERPVSLKRANPDYYEMFRSSVDINSEYFV